MPAPVKNTGSEHIAGVADRQPPATADRLAELVRAHRQPAVPALRKAEQAVWARWDAASPPPHAAALFQVPSVLGTTPHDSREPDEPAARRLRELAVHLDALGAAFPAIRTDITLCRDTCELLEAAWRTRADHGDQPARADGQPCGCALCTCLPDAPARQPGDYTWRRSDGRPLAVKVWPYRRELDCVLTGGWVWTRGLNDTDRDLGLRARYEDDILTFHEYRRVIDTLDAGRLAGNALDGLAARFSVNGARALVVGLFAAYKRRVDEYWLGRHAAGTLPLSPATRLDLPTYAMLQLMDCLFWHVPPDRELWQETSLAALLMCRVLDDMTDVRADALTGEISNFWLSAMSTHDKALYAACAIAMVKFGCTPEAHGEVWNAWLMPSTMAWMALTGRHALWFDGIAPNSPVAPEQDCVLCGLYPTTGEGLWSGGLTLRSGPRPVATALSEAGLQLTERCRNDCPIAWPLLRREMAAFEALHGPWRGNVDTCWPILRRTYVAAVAAMLTQNTGTARAIQVDAGAVGAEMFHALNNPGSDPNTTARDDTALLAYLTGCAHPHFLWNCLGHAHGQVHSDWLDG
jgi:hypothetical protein